MSTSAYYLNQHLNLSNIWTFLHRSRSTSQPCFYRQPWSVPGGWEKSRVSIDVGYISNAMYKYNTVWFFDLLFPFLNWIFKGRSICAWAILLVLARKSAVRMAVASKKAQNFIWKSHPSKINLFSFRHCTYPVNAPPCVQLKAALQQIGQQNSLQCEAGRCFRYYHDFNIICVC